MAKNTYQKLIDALFGETVQLNLAENASAEEPFPSSGLTLLNLTAPEVPVKETAIVPEVVESIPTEQKNLQTDSSTAIAVIDLGRGTSSQLERKLDARLLRNYAKYSVWVRAALNYKREKLGRAQFEIIPRDSTEKPNRVDKFVRAEVESLIRHPNSAGDSYGILKEQLLEDYYVIGHGCFELDLFNDLTVRSIRIMDAARIGFVKNWNGTDNSVPRYVEFADNYAARVKRFLASEQVLCMVNTPMSNTKLGFSHVEALHRTIVALLSGDEFLIRQILQPVSEKLISLGEGVTQTQVDSFKYQIQQVRDKLAVIGGAKDPKVINLSASADEMKILDGCEWFVRQVAAIFNISTAKLKLAVDTSRANTSEMMADDLEGLEGDLTRIIEIENSCFIDRYEYKGEINLKFSYPIMHRKDEKQQAFIARQQTGTPWGSINEARSRTGEKEYDEQEMPFCNEPIILMGKGTPVPYSIWVKEMQERENNIGKEPAPATPPEENADDKTTAKQ